jgi:uncharacterized protein YjbI with pentapeptide repeats
MSPEVTAAIIAGGVGIITVAATVVVQIVGFRLTKANTEQQIRATHKDTADTLGHQRQQLDRTLAEQRTRTLNERFATAAEQLGSDKPAVRLAGVYAMAGLADDWEENRQTCVDVLCAYLHMPYEPDPGQDASAAQILAFQATREVRHTVIRVIAAHLKKDAAVRWQGLDFDFTGVVFDGGEFTGAQFTGGLVSFATAQFTGDAVFFGDVQFSGAEVRFTDAQFTGGTVWLSGAEFSGSTVYFVRARFGGATVYLGGAQFTGGTVYFSGAQFTAGTVDFSFAEFSGGRVTFGGAVFLGGEIDFAVTKFSGSIVDFGNAQFSGATVDFSTADDWSFPPAFSWTGRPPKGLKLPRKEDQSED